MPLSDHDGGRIGFWCVEKDGLASNAGSQASEESVSCFGIVGKERPYLETLPTRAKHTVANEVLIVQLAESCCSGRHYG